MNIIDKLWTKRQQWIVEGNPQSPNCIIFPPKDFWEFKKHLSELDSNHSMPLSWLRGIQTFSSTGATEIKMGIVV